MCMHYKEAVEDFLWIKMFRVGKEEVRNAQNSQSAPLLRDVSADSSPPPQKPTTFIHTPEEEGAGNWGRGWGRGGKSPWHWRTHRQLRMPSWDTPAFVSWQYSEKGKFNEPVITSLLLLLCTSSCRSSAFPHSIIFWVVVDLVICAFIWTIRSLFWGLEEYDTHMNNAG